MPTAHVATGVLTAFQKTFTVKPLSYNSVQTKNILTTRWLKFRRYDYRVTNQKTLQPNRNQVCQTNKYIVTATYTNLAYVHITLGYRYIYCVSEDVDSKAMEFQLGPEIENIDHSMTQGPVIRL